MTQPRKEQLNILTTHWSRITVSVSSGDGYTVVSGPVLEAASITGVAGGDANAATAARGIVTVADGYYNLVKIRNNSDGQAVLDAGGAGQAYGRLTYDGVDYTITYYATASGTETAATLPGSGSYDADILFPEVMYFGEVPVSSAVTDEAGFSRASGSGGKLLQFSEVVETADNSRTGTGYVQLGSQSITMTVSSLSKLHCRVSCAYANNSGGTITLFRVLLDGSTTLASKAQTSWGSADAEGVDFSVSTAALSAGPHTISFQWNTNGGATAFCNTSSNPTQHSCVLTVMEIGA